MNDTEPPKLVLGHDDESPLFKMNEDVYAKRKIDEEEDIQKADLQKNTIATRLRQYMIMYNYIDALEVFNAVNSFLLFFIFILQTYQKPRLDPDEIVNYDLDWLIVPLEIIILIIIIMDYLLFFYINDNRVLYIFDFQQLITYVTVIPTLLMRLNVIQDEYIIETFYLKLWKVARLASVYRLIKVFTRNKMQIGRVYFKLIFYVFLIIFIFGSSMLTFENDAFIEVMRKERLCKKLQNCGPDWQFDPSKSEITLYFFHDIFYYIIVTMTTVGYGDISPQTTIG